MENHLYLSFSKWLDGILSQSLPEDTIAFNFNIYHGSADDDEENMEYHIEIIGAVEFDEYDDDWACEESFNTRENIFVLKAEDAGDDRDDGHEFVKLLVLYYLEKGKYKDILKSKLAVAIGFVDGDLEILYRNIN